MPLAESRTEVKPFPLTLVSSNSTLPALVPDTAFQRVFALFTKDMNPTARGMFAGLALKSISDGHACMTVPTDFLRHWLESRYAYALLECWQKVMPEISSITILNRGCVTSVKSKYTDSLDFAEPERSVFPASLPRLIQEPKGPAPKQELEVFAPDVLWKRVQDWYALATARLRMLHNCYMLEFVAIQDQVAILSLPADDMFYCNTIAGKLLLQAWQREEPTIIGLLVRLVPGKRNAECEPWSAGTAVYITDETESDVTLSQLFDLRYEAMQLAAGIPFERRIRIEDIQRIVAKHFGVSRADLISHRRTRVIVKPRQIGMYLAKTLTPRSFPEIGRRFGGRDHTTVLHAVRKVEMLIATDAAYAAEVEHLIYLVKL